VQDASSGDRRDRLPAIPIHDRRPRVIPGRPNNAIRTTETTSRAIRHGWREAAKSSAAPDNAAWHPPRRPITLHGIQRTAR
jgi:hypothetical protein